MDPSAEPALETQATPAPRFAGFWRRVVALAADGLVLGAMGYPLGLLLGERYAPVGTPARLLGLLVIVPYLGILGSHVGRGQTLGKRLVGLRIVDASGQPLSLARSFARAALLALPWVFNGIRFGSMGPVALATLGVAGILAFGVGGAIVGTFLLNRPTRQALHDLLVGSFVVPIDATGLPVPGRSTRRPLVASAVWVGLVAVATTAMVLLGPELAAGRIPPVLMARLAAIPGARSMEVKHLATSGSSSRIIVAVLWFQGPPAEMKGAAREVAAAMLQHLPDAATAPRLVVTVIRGWDVGVANMTSAETFARTPEQWRAELEP